MVIDEQTLAQLDAEQLRQMTQRLLGELRYQRARPFVENGAPTCTPEDEADLRGNGSYPSGHTAIG